jgi:hypothetical protein
MEHRALSGPIGSWRCACRRENDSGKQQRVGKVVDPFYLASRTRLQQVCDSPYKETTRTIALTFCDGMKNGWIGRCMPRLFASHGIANVAVKDETVFVTYEF